MAHWNLPTGLQVTEGTARDTATSLFGGTVVTAGAIANTKGLWTELIASTLYDATLLSLHVHNTSANSRHGRVILDVGIGGVGFEAVLVPDLLVGATLVNDPRKFFLPVSVPAGSRISGRSSAFSINIPATVQCDLLGGSPLFGGATYAIDALGIDQASSSGVNLTAHASIHTWGAWTDIVTSTSYDYAGFIPALQGQWTGGITGTNNLVQFGCGPSGSERELATVFAGSTSQEVLNVSSLPVLLPGAPAGSRLCARTQSGITLNAHVQAALYGLRG